MSAPQVNREDREVVLACLTAAIDQSLFPEWEFATIIGVTRQELSAMRDSWSLHELPSPAMQDAVANVLLNLIGYPHGRHAELNSMVGVSCSELERVLARWDGRAG
jgi:hypothetical protein